MPLKIGGVEIKGPKTALLVIPRENQDIALKFVAVTDDAEYDLLVPMPIPPKVMKVGVGTIENYEDTNYKAALKRRGEYREDWYFLESIKPSKIEWETVKAENPETWKNWREEFKTAGFSVLEINTIYATFLETNVLSDKMLDEARLRFLASQQAE
jgi:hypothetical protein